MRIALAALVSGGILALGATASAQAPAPLPPPGPGAAAPVWAPPAPPPGPVWSPPPGPGAAVTPGWPAPAPPPLAFTPGSPPAAPPPQGLAAPPEPARADAPIDLAHRVGFGLGFWLAPAGLAGNNAGAGALGGLGALDGGGAHYGGLLGVRWWVRDRVVLIPSLILAITRRTIPDSDQINSVGGTFTEGTFAPSLSAGYAAYRGKTSRFVLSAGLGFRYEAGSSTVTVEDASGNFHQEFVPAKYVSFEVPVGFSFEQFFSSKISMALGGGAPLFMYSRGQVDTRAAQTSIGASFAMAQLSASVQLYTD